MVAAYASQRNPKVAGVVASSAVLSMPEVASRARVIAFRGLKWLAPRLSLASQLDPKALSRDPEVVRAYLEDPLVQRKITASLASASTCSSGWMLSISTMGAPLNFSSGTTSIFLCSFLRT